MTEKEKKEFEEFLQWKAERDRNQKPEEQSVEINDNTDTMDNNGNAPVSSTVCDKNTEPQTDNSGLTALIVIVTIIAIFLLFIVLIGTTGKNKQSEQKEFYDSTAVVVADKPSAKPVFDAKKDSIARAERISKVKKTIKITSAYLGRPNSASGVDAYFYYKNLSDKTIKYLIWEGYPINAVGDRVDCEIRGYRNYRGRDTGPVKPGRSSGGCWGCAWYNSTAKKLILTGVEIEYMDGSTFTIKESEIEYVR